MTISESCKSFAFTNSFVVRIFGDLVDDPSFYLQQCKCNVLKIMSVDHLGREI